ncbi:MAG TPA: hypothetical protein PK200_07935 [Spirochaetota bacterium]|nr:hypothetical protein [Spirochaetota bacterium]HQP49960.1 hypothetical protein [Spirochaetota bacterium]
MAGDTIIKLGSGTGWAWAAAAGHGAGLIFMVILAAVLIGFSLVHRNSAPFSHFWIGGIVALAGAVFFVYEGSRLFVTAAVIEIKPAGTWDIYAPAGNKIGSVAPATERTFLLWAEVNSWKTAPYFDSLYGIIKTADGKTFTLKPSGSFDLLIRMGYGPYWLDHENLTLAEQKEAGAMKAKMIYAGRDKSRSLVLPLHSYDAGGISAVQTFLLNRARQ